MEESPKVKGRKLKRRKKMFSIFGTARANSEENSEEKIKEGITIIKMMINYTFFLSFRW